MSRGGRPVITITLNEEEKDELLSITHSRTLPHGLVQPAQAVPVTCSV